jgi:uncharacterized protein
MTKGISDQKINPTRLITFLIIAFCVSNIFRFNLFHFNEILEKKYNWSYLIIESVLEGSGIFLAGIFGLYQISKKRSIDVSFFGSSKLKSILMALIPTILLIVIGVKNKYEINAHLFGLIAAFGTFLYCIMEEYGWRGYLNEEFKFLKPVLRFVLVGFIWYTWHLSFLTKVSLIDNLTFMATLIAGSWGIGKIVELTNSILVCACFHLIVNIFMYNSFFNNAFEGYSKLIIFGVSVILWILIIIWWEKDLKKQKV